jgi:hypothetical protein
MQSEATEATPVGKLLPKKAVAQTLAVCNRTVMMRVKSDPSFPRPRCQMIFKANANEYSRRRKPASGGR